MSCIRPATPGFLVTLVATGLLAVVSFCVPYFKSVYFLKAAISVSNVNGSITFGTLGYCLELANGTTCSKPSIGYELDINGLVGNRLPIEIPQVAVKWLTYALVLHLVALGLAAGSAVFGLLAHVREMSMTCCSTCISGFAAAVALLAFVFDLALFFAAKARINAVGTATMGNAIWLTLAAWILLFFSGCFYTLGRCCVSKRPRGSGGGSGGSGGSGRKWAEEGGNGGGSRFSFGRKNDYAEQMRLDAVKAEADRKARQKEAGLPAFAETQPLTGRVEGDHVYFDDQPSKSKDELSLAPTSLSSRPSQTLNSGTHHAGYVQGTPGNRAVDDYYNPITTTSPPAPNTYPPQQHPQRQGSAHNYAAGGYLPSPQAPPQRQPSAFSMGDGAAGPGYYGANQTTSPPPMPAQTLAVPGQSAYSDPYNQYGHTAGGSSYHTAYASGNEPTAFDPYAPNPYSPQPHTAYGQAPTFMSEQSYIPPVHHQAPSTSPSMPQANYGQYNPGVPEHSATPPPTNHVSSYYGARPSPPGQRQYTLGGDGYGENSVPPLQGSDPYYSTTGNTAYATGGAYSSPVGGPRTQPTQRQPSLPEESPPGYDAGNSGVTGNWGKA